MTPVAGAVGSALNEGRDVNPGDTGGHDVGARLEVVRSTKAGT